MSESVFKLVDWIGSSYKDFRAFPDEVQDHMGYALHLAQKGDKHEDAKPLKGFGGAGVLEIVSDHVGDTYRAVCTVKFATAIYVLMPSRRSRRPAAKLPSPTWNWSSVGSRRRKRTTRRGLRKERNDER